MHKDPPPSFFERPLRRLIIEGVVAGVIASIIFVGAWTLASANQVQLPRERMPLLKDRR